MSLLNDKRDDARSVSVEPSVIVGVVDHFMRRQEGQKRVIGALVGKLDAETGSVTVTSSFPVPHAEKENGEVAIGKDFKTKMGSFHARHNAGAIVGWYATSCEDGSLISEHSCLIHDFFSAECECPVHVVVDTALGSDQLNVRAFTSQPLTVASGNGNNDDEEEEVYAAEFRPIACAVVATDGDERAVLGALAKGATSIDGSIGALERNLTKLLALIDTASAYVDDVAAERRLPDAKVGRQIYDLVARMPRVKPEMFSASFDKNMQDLLAISYLSKIVQTQLALGSFLQ